VPLLVRSRARADLINDRCLRREGAFVVRLICTFLQRRLRPLTVSRESEVGRAESQPLSKPGGSLITTAGTAVTT
jgi:hypothetical protein